MAQLIPFKALLPDPDLIANVPTRSLYTYTEDERKESLDMNPSSFLHVLYPDHGQGPRKKGVERYKAIRQKLQDFKEQGIFQHDESATFYVYAIDLDDRSYSGIIAGVSTNDYNNDVIKKHEDTLQRRVELFTNYLEHVQFNAEPVLLTYPDNSAISNWIAKIKSKPPRSSFLGADGGIHSLWAVSESEAQEELKVLFASIPSIYIADGHHRSASSAQFTHSMRQNKPEYSGYEAFNNFMGYLIPESELRISEFNRMVKDLHGHSTETLLDALAGDFFLEEAPYPNLPKEKKSIGMYLQGKWYLLRPKPHQATATDLVESLDPQILYTRILEPILGIKDLRKDQRIEYLYGKNSLIQMEEEIDRGNFAVGFGLAPILMSEIKAVADAGKVMPPKSTYIEPKLLSGLTIYEY
ncbi:MAG: DUF1015 domain-containing protein [Flavobacteriaceae bacterium]|nr:DUF1015 domain-containing protein [Flavobacteriaceae bacterium]